MNPSRVVEAVDSSRMSRYRVCLVVVFASMVLPLRTSASEDTPGPSMHSLKPTWEVPLGHITAVTLVAADQVIVGDSRGAIHFIDPKTGTVSAKVDAHVSEIVCLESSRKRDVLYSLDGVGDIVIWDPIARRAVRRFNVGDSARELTLSGDENTVAIRYLGLSAAVNRFRVFDGKIIDSTPFPRYANPIPRQHLSLQKLALNHDGTQACLILNRKVVIFDFDKGEVIEEVEVPEGLFGAATFAPGMETSVILPRKVEVWANARERRIAETAIPAEGVLKGKGPDAVALSAERKLIAVALGGVVGQPSYIWLWKWSEPQASVAFQFSKSSLVHDLAFSDDGNALFTISDDKMVRRFDIQTLMPVESKAK